ncbi:MAG TPA: cadherin domain-containing protein [Allosphingosinicella sp.]|jgi:Ca2+-binding RTX toxin-like protein
MVQLYSRDDAQLFAAAEAPTTDISISNLEVEETAIENVAVAILSATGAGGGFSYEIVADSSGGAFRIEGDRLVVEDNARLDYEAAPQVTLTIRATDSDGRSHEESFTLDVLDVEYERRYSQEPDFLANSTEVGLQGGSRIVPLAGGGFALIWQQYDSSDPVPLKTVLRIFGPDGAPLSAEQVIADKWLGNYDVTPLANGGFLIVREAYNEPQGTFSIKAQAYDFEGHSAGPEIVVGSSQSGTPHSPAAVELSSGEYLISWATAQGEVRAQRVDPQGEATGEAFTIAGSAESVPIALAATPPSGFVAAWVEPRESGEDPFVIRARIYGYHDEIGGEGVAIPVSAMDIGDVSVIALPDGGYLLGWVETRDELEGVLLQVVMAQLLDPDGRLVGEPLELTAFIAEADFGEVSFAPHPDQGFVVLWPMIDSASASGGEIAHGFVGSLFNECGCPIGSAFQPTALGEGGVATVLADGTIATSWTGFDSDDRGIFARVYRPADEPFDLSGDDHLVGDEQVNRLDGQGGDDRIYGLDEDDELIGGPGNDILDGGPGADAMTGGTGNDVYVVDDEGDEVVEAPGEGTDEVRTDLADFSLAGLPDVENLVGTSTSGQSLTGNSRDNSIYSGGGDDLIDLQAGGDDSVFASEGDDVFLFGGSMTGLDAADGGAGIDQIVLQGDYSGPNALTFGAGITLIENLAILPGNDMRFGDPGTSHYDYDITLLDSNVASGVQMIVDANRLRPGEDFTFNGSAEIDGSFFIYGGGGADNLTGGRNDDVFLFGAQGQWNAGDIVNGGPGGIDQLALRGDYTIAFGAAQLAGIEQIGMVSAFDTRFGALGETYDYNLTMNDGNVAGIQMTVDAAPLRPSETLTFDGSAEDDGSFRVFGGAGADVVAGSQNGDILVGRGGADSLTGNGGNDSFRYNSASESATGAVDRILDFTPGADSIDLSRIDSNSHAEGNQAFRWIGSDSFTGTGAASAGELRAYQQGRSWFVEGDTDGNGSADLIIEVVVVGSTPLGPDHFVL